MGWSFGVSPTAVSESSTFILNGNEKSGLFQAQSHVEGVLDFVKGLVYLRVLLLSMAPHAHSKDTIERNHKDACGCYPWIGLGLQLITTNYAQVSIIE